MSKHEIKYHSMKDIIEGMRVSCECGIRERAFDWQEINIRGFINRHRIMKACKPYGKIKHNRHGFVVKFIY